MDLSTGGDLDACRDAIIRHSSVPIGTVPIYSMIIGRRIENLTIEMVLETLEHQAQQGVDYFTIHAGVLHEHLQYVRDRSDRDRQPRRLTAGQMDDSPQQTEPDVHALGRYL
jgi:phosphomethylpyrimidine synthase